MSHEAPSWSCAFVNHVVKFGKSADHELTARDISSPIWRGWFELEIPLVLLVNLMKETAVEEPFKISHTNERETRIPSFSQFELELEVGIGSPSKNEERVY